VVTVGGATDVLAGPIQRRLKMLIKNPAIHDCDFYSELLFGIGGGHLQDTWG